MKNPLSIVLQYLAERQAPKIRALHITILLLVITQIILSNIMHVDHNGQFSTNPLEYVGTWAHIIVGLITLLVALVFVSLELGTHGLKYFFPYLFGEFGQLKQDLLTLKALRLPEPNPYGLATIVQGLGLGAVGLVLLSGAIWFYAWLGHAAWADQARELHETLTGLIEAYIIGHGGLGLLHIFFPGLSTKPEPT